MTNNTSVYRSLLLPTGCLEGATHSPLEFLHNCTRQLQAPPPPIGKPFVSNVAAYSVDLSWEPPTDFWQALSVTGYQVSTILAGFISCCILPTVAATLLCVLADFFKTSAQEEWAHQLRVAAQKVRQRLPEKENNIFVKKHSSAVDAMLNLRRQPVPGVLATKYEI